MENRYSLSSILALYQQYNSNHQVFNKREDFKLFQLVDSCLFPLYPNNLLVATLHSNVSKMASQLEMFDRRNEMLAIESTFPIIELPSVSGETFRLADVRARFILVDFWATWCNSCIPNNKIYRQIYNDFQRKGFELVQVSLDDDQEKLLGTIERDSLEWKHVSDFKAWNSTLVDTLQVNSIPANYLVDRRGIIVARNITPKELRDFLQKNLP
jgi:peroxiredoxin